MSGKSLPVETREFIGRTFRFTLELEGLEVVRRVAEETGVSPDDAFLGIVQHALAQVEDALEGRDAVDETQPEGKEQ